MRSPVRLYYQNSEGNFGDILSREITQKASGADVAFSDLKYADLVAIGSLAERVVKKRFKRWLINLGRPLHLWGTGFLAPGESTSGRFIRAHALRGKLSAARFNMDIDKICLGDPGLLCSHFFPSDHLSKGQRVLCLPHLHDHHSGKWIDTIRCKFPNDNVVQMSLADDHVTIIEAIMSAKLVITTAMHPYIVAHSYDVPTAYLQTGSNIHVGGDYKIYDYLSVFGREALCSVDCSELTKGRITAEQLYDVAESDRVSVEVVKRIQEELLDSFPQEYKA